MTEATGDILDWIIAGGLTLLLIGLLIWGAVAVRSFRRLVAKDMSSGWRDR